MAIPDPRVQMKRYWVLYLKQSNVKMANYCIGNGPLRGDGVFTLFELIPVLKLI